MFTGLVAETGVLRTLDRDATGARVEVEAALAAELEPGGSVAVDGVCLTASSAGDTSFRAEIVEETLARSSLGRLAPGDRVNLELPLRAGDRLGGHFVQGHVDGVGTVESVAPEGMALRVRIAADPSLCRYVADKGSVTVDGVSLTAVDPADDGFEIALVPETLTRTTLGAVEPGRTVNLEVDVLAKYVERLAIGDAIGAGIRP
jgi:riboflavin synthase